MMGDQLHDKREAICDIPNVYLGTRELCTKTVQRSLGVNKTSTELELVKTTAALRSAVHLVHLTSHQPTSFYSPK
jgi:hypothetical protein